MDVDLDLAEAIRIVAGNVGMSAHDRHRILVALGDWVEPVIPTPPADPRDAEIADLRAQLEAKPRGPIRIRQLKKKVVVADG